MVKINNDACIGCGACQALVSDVFDINGDGLAYVLEDAKVEENIEDVKEAANNCPTDAIIIEEN